MLSSPSNHVRSHATTRPASSRGRLSLTFLLATAAAFLLVPASQAFAEHGEPHLTVNIEGIEGGGGKVKSPWESSPEYPGSPPIACLLEEGATETTGTCENDMDEAEPGVWAVSLQKVTGEIAPNSKIKEWIVGGGGIVAGGCSAEFPGCTVGTFGEDVEVTAVFECEEGKECAPPTFALNLSTSGTGSGSLECKVNGGAAEACQPEYTEGDAVEVVQSADPGSEFVEFTGDCSGTGTCEVTMDEERSVGAVFDLIERSLTINIAGTGSGTVSCNGGECAASYPHGTELTLTATAASGSTFAGWSGGGCSGTGTCVLTLEADTTVTATFTANPPLPDTCDTNPALCPKQPPETCETNPALCPPGAATANGVAQVKGNKALLKLRCFGGPCKGTLKLTAKVKQGGKTKSKVIGKASFSLAAGTSKTIKMKIANSQVKKLLTQGKTVKSKLSGAGIQSRTVKLKPATKKAKPSARPGRRR